MSLPHRTVRLDLGVVVLSSGATLVVGFVAAVVDGFFYLLQRVFYLIRRVIYAFQRRVGLLESVALLALVAVGCRWPTLEFRWSERSVRVQSPGRFERR